MYRYKAKVVSVYDGDTVRCDIFCGFGIIKTRESIRLFGINAPEIRGAAKVQGTKSRDYLRSIILDKEIILETIKDKKGKYGRYLGVIHIEGYDMSVNDMMVDSGMAIYKDY